MSGIIGVSPDMRSGVVGAWPKGHIIQIVGDTDNTPRSIVQPYKLNYFASLIRSNKFQLHHAHFLLELKL